MNINDVAVFLDLVSDPAKYKQALTQIKDEQDRLNEIIATVGKASQLDRLRKQVETEQATYASEYASKLEALAKEQAIQQEAIQAQQIAAIAAQTSADDTLQKALTEAQAAKQLAASFAGREKELRIKEDSVIQAQNKVDKLIAEYEEKVAKLRAVMV